MPIIKSISGIRGTIGDKQGEDLTSSDVIDFTKAYGALVRQKSSKDRKITMIVGRDARISGLKIKKLVIETLNSLGIDVIDIDLTTTPTIEMAIIKTKAQGGIMITASHNPKEWNALKLLNDAGEFISAAEGNRVVTWNQASMFVDTGKKRGEVAEDNSFLQYHIDRILNLDLVRTNLLAKKNFKVVVDGINSTGGIAIPLLLEALGVKDVIKINCEANGDFSHNPEPLEKNLSHIMKVVKENRADLGIVVDPDVDRLAFIDEQGNMFGEEYTLVAVADYILEHFSEDRGYNRVTVSNLSSSRALADIAIKRGAKHHMSAVGEVNVVAQMKKVKAVIGGEGNGGVIYPELHYGRDALVGTALFLSMLAEKNIQLSKLKKTWSQYTMVKDRIDLSETINLEDIFDHLRVKYSQQKINDIDGLRIDWDDLWVHLRPSNTEPIIRLYAEARDPRRLENIIGEIKEVIFANIK